MTFEFPIPENPNSNKLRGRHWRVRYNLEIKYWEHLDMLVACRLLPRTAIGQPWDRATGKAVLRTCPVMDQDNASHRMKWVWDWLQSRGYIVNDRDVRCDVTPVASKRKEQGVTLELEAS